jgi:hypothetical protein
MRALRARSGGGLVKETDRQVSAAAADLAAVIERAAGDLSLEEEPSNFVVALERGAGEDR